MWLAEKKYSISFKPFILLAFLLLDNPSFSQQKIPADTVPLAFPDKNFFVNRVYSVYFTETLMKIYDELVPAPVSRYDQNSLFLDSLKIKASKTLITRKLYDLLVISGNPVPTSRITGSSDRDFKQFSGMRIRNIEIRKLTVFDSNINDPLPSNPDKIEGFLNKTHINTNDIIIRNNLIFSEGDSVSPLKLSDNERILRQLPYIDDSRILLVPVSDEEVDIIVVTKDVYSLGASFDYGSIKRGSLALFDKNIAGIGHEFRIEVPYDSDLPDSPGFGVKYNIDNLRKSFINLRLFYFNGLGTINYGFDLARKLVSSETKYAGGISVRQMFTTEDLDTLIVPEAFNYTLQDYWVARSFLLNKESVSRIIIGARYTNNNVFDRPFILPDSYHYLQKYKMLLGSLTFSMQKYYKTNLIYNYGRTEDIPYGGMVNITLGREINEFKGRYYSAISLAVGGSMKETGYFRAETGISAFTNDGHTEQGTFIFRTNYFSNLHYIGRSRIRNFIKFDYTRGFDRYSDEFLSINYENGFSGIRNDSLSGTQRLSLGVESVLFIPGTIYGFRFAVFGFADLGFLFGTNEFVNQGEIVSSIGVGVRLRNDNLVFNTFQIRLGFFPNLPQYSRANYFLVSGEQLLKPDNFEPGPPSLLPYH